MKIIHYAKLYSHINDIKKTSKDNEYMFGMHGGIQFGEVTNDYVFYMNKNEFYSSRNQN